MTPQLAWTYERDECWGPDGEPLLSAQLRGEQLMVRVRNSRRYGLEVVLSPVGSGAFDEEPEGPAFKVSFDERALQPLQARVQDSGELAFVADVRRLVAELNCANRLRLHARPRRGGVWLQLDTTYDDLRLDRLVEPASGIGLVYRDEARQRRAEASRTSGGAAHTSPPRPRPRPAPVAAPAPSATEELISAVAPLAALAIGAKLGRKMFGPDRRG